MYWALVDNVGMHTVFIPIYHTTLRVEIKVSVFAVLYDGH
jgi:hypothetical protein